MKRFLWSLLSWTVCILLASSTLPDGKDVAWAQASKSDVGLVTKLSGDVKYAEAASPERMVPGEPFMKVRPGDLFSISATAGLQIVYFQNGRQETWKGPASFQVGAAESVQGGKDVRPEVKSLPAGSASESRRIPSIMDRARKYGGTQVSRLQGLPSDSGVGRSRGLSEGIASEKPGREMAERLPPDRPRALAPSAPGRAAPPSAAPGARASAPTKRELAEDPRTRMEKAKETYRALRDQSGEDDITPELYLVGILDAQGEYEELRKVVREAIRRQPGNEDLKALEKWAGEKASPRLPGR
jgi:hypothetical protein